jgi:signal peptidase II
MARSSGKGLRFWGTFLAVVLLDVVTKVTAERVLMPRQLPHDVLGDAVRFTLVFNPGAAFGLNLGPLSRWIFLGLTLLALVILARLYRTSEAGDTPRVLALGLVCGGAVGNLIDRIRSPIGVVDFIDVGIGDHRWPTFNVADMAVSTGALLLAWVLWSEDRQTGVPVVAPATAAAPTAPSEPPPTRL